jgi:hypothetical protein
MLQSCGKKNDSIKFIDIKKSNAVLSSETIIKNGRYIKLETNSQSTIGEIETVKLYKDKIYILDRTGSFSRILVFDLSGKFVHEIGSSGRGPEEIDGPRAFCFKDSSIYVWDSSVHHLTISNKYIDKLFKCFVQGSTFDIKDNDFLIFHGPSDEVYLSVFDYYGNLKKEFKVDGINYNLGSSGNDAIMTFCEGKTFYTIMLDVIYKLEDDRLAPAYKFRYHNMLSISDIIPQQSVNAYELLQAMRSKPHCSNIKYFENDKLIFANHHYNRKRINTILYKDNWKAISFAKLLDKKLNMDVTPDFMLDSVTFCKVLNIYEFSEKKELNPNAVPELNNLLKTSKIDDNPILFLYNFSVLR